MEKEENETSELVSNKTKTDTILTIGEDGSRRPVVQLEGGKINISTLKIAMSRKHRFVMFIDLWTIAWASALTVYLASLGALAQYKWYVVAGGILTVVSAIGKTVGDFHNWLYTVNVMQEQMGSWYLDDIVGICQDFMSADAKIAAEEKQSAQTSKTVTEEGDAVLEDYSN